MAVVPMSVQDELWLTMDRPNNLMVVDGAMLLRGSPGLEEVRDIYRALVEKFPVFGRRAVRHGRGWGWADDPGFDIAAHVDEVRLPAPVTVASVQSFMSSQRSAPLDPDRPRWTAHVIRDLELADGSVGSALVTRFHHAIADGVRLTQVMLGMCDSPTKALEAVVVRDPGASGPGGPAAALGHIVAETAQGAADAAASTAHALRHPLHTAGGLPGAVQNGVRSAGDITSRAAQALRLGAHGMGDGFELVRHPDRLLDALEVLGIADHRSLNDLSSVTKLALAGTPHTVWTGRPGTVKAVAWSEPIPLADIRSVGQAMGATVNDVMLAAVAGALRTYLQQHGGLVDEVIWMVPVNLKPFEDNLPPDLGNYFALVFLPMALYHPEAAERLAHMHQAMLRVKHSDEAVLTFGMQRAVSMSPGQMAYFLTNFFANKAVGVLTNVPGPHHEMTFGGVPVAQVIGFAPCSGNQPMTATIFSYAGGVTIGFATDGGLVPDPNVLVDLVVEEIANLVARV